MRYNSEALDWIGWVNVIVICPGWPHGLSETDPLPIPKVAALQRLYYDDF